MSEEVILNELKNISKQMDKQNNNVDSNSSKISSLEKDSALIFQQFTEVLTRMASLKKDMNDGFRGMHSRQDQTNGKVLQSQKDVEQLKQEDIRMGDKVSSLLDNSSRFNTKTWEIAKMAIPFIGFLIVYWITTQ